MQLMAWYQNFDKQYTIGSDRWAYMHGRVSIRQFYSEE